MGRAGCRGTGRRRGGGHPHTILVPTQLPAPCDRQTLTMNLRPSAFRITLPLLASLALASPAAPRAEFVPWEEAAPIVAASATDTLPQDLAGRTPQQLLEMWPDW